MKPCLVYLMYVLNHIASSGIQHSCIPLLASQGPICRIDPCHLKQGWLSCARAACAIGNLYPTRGLAFECGPPHLFPAKFAPLGVHSIVYLLSHKIAFRGHEKEEETLNGGGELVQPINGRNVSSRPSRHEWEGKHTPLWQWCSHSCVLGIVNCDRTSTRQN